MIERLKNFIERILARDRNLLHPNDKRGSITEPVSFEELPSELQVLLGNRAAEQARLIGLRTAEMHLKLSEGPGIDFRPEEYSLHYQRSLFSAMQSLVRETYQSLERKIERLPENLRKEAMMLASMKEVLLQSLRRIYFKKLDIVKIRIHGTYNLRKLLMTGKDIVIHDFGGNTARSYSERRIRRSPIRDLAEMISSFYYTAYEAFFSNDHIPSEENNNLMPFADQWAHYMSGFFMNAYIDLVKNSSLIPKQKEEFKIVLDTFLLEKSLAHLNFELNNRPEWSVVPLHLINTVLQINKEKLEPAYE
jgi:maltose alpha-D-glucosyltransferase/alpha-amylase